MDDPDRRRGLLADDVEEEAEVCRSRVCLTCSSSVSCVSSLWINGGRRRDGPAGADEVGETEGDKEEDVGDEGASGVGTAR